MFEYSIGDITKTDIEIFKASFYHMIDERKEKILRLKSTKQQKLSLLGEWLAKSLISKKFDVDVEKIVFQRDENGKPFCPEFPNIFFNISHSEDMAIAVISDNPIGVDIEKLRAVSLKVARRACTEDELIYVFNHIPAENDYEIPYPHPVYERFWEIWTAKEAYFKCIGTGITNLKKINTLALKNKEKLIIDDYIIHLINIMRLPENE